MLKNVNNGTHYAIVLITNVGKIERSRIDCNLILSYDLLVT